MAAQKDETKDPTSPRSTSYAYDAMQTAWAIVEALLGGTEAMRAAGDMYMPRHQEETDQGYQNRLQATTLNNLFEQTLNNLSGRPFAEDVEINDDVPAKILPYLDDIDLAGNKLDVFLRDWFRSGMAKAFAHVLVDMPRIEPKADGMPRTLADDAHQNLRPYTVLISPENVLQITEELIDGVPTVTHARILEKTLVMDGFAEVPSVQIKVLEPGTVAIWKIVETNKSNGKIEWYKADEWATDWDYVPLVTFYAGTRKDTMRAKSPLLDLAYLNVAHWQSTSEQRNALTVARFPLLACEGSEENDSTVILGPNRILYGGKFSYVESTGAALEAGRLDLETLEEQMANYGSEFLKNDPGDPTATAKAIDTAESSASLSAIVLKFEDAVAQVLSFMARMARATTDGATGLYMGGTVELVKDFAPDLADGQGLVAVTAGRTNKDLSRESWIDVMLLRGLLPEDFDKKKNEQQLEQENQDALEQGMALMNLDPGAPTPAPKPPNGPPAAPKPPAPKPPAAPKPPKV